MALNAASANLQREQGEEVCWGRFFDYSQCTTTTALSIPTALDKYLCHWTEWTLIVSGVDSLDLKAVLLRTNTLSWSPHCGLPTGLNPTSLQCLCSSWLRADTRSPTSAFPRTWLLGALSWFCFSPPVGFATLSVSPSTFPLCPHGLHPVYTFPFASSPLCFVFSNLGHKIPLHLAQPGDSLEDSTEFLASPYDSQWRFDNKPSIQSKDQ